MTQRNAGRIFGVVLLLIIAVVVVGCTVVNADSMANGYRGLVHRMDLSVQATAVPTSVPTTVPTTVPTAVPTTIPTAVPTTIPTAVPTTVPTAVPTTVPQISISLENIEQVLDALSEEGLRVDSGILFGESWMQKTGPVLATLPDNYNVTVVSSDPATFVGSTKFHNGNQGWIAVVVSEVDFQIQNVGYSQTNLHRNVSAYSLAVNLEDDEMLDFVSTLSAFEWLKERKPALFVVIDNVVYRFDSTTVDLANIYEGALKDMIDEVFDPAAN